MPASDVPSQRALAWRLIAVRAIHTLVWAFFAACIIAVPIVAWLQRPRLAAALVAVTSVEVVVLLLNDWSCPLTGVAARYTDNRRDNFDIFLPEWLARHNKRIFGALYAGGACFAAFLWYFRHVT